MAALTPLTEDAGVELTPSTDRVVARPFLPGGAVGQTPRTVLVVQRILDAADDVVAEQASRIRERFAGRHADLDATLRDHAARADPGLLDADLDEDRLLLLGATFTAELSLEGAALCNPSAVVHPDQSGLAEGRLRLLLSLRSIGEPHLSSIQFCEAVVGPGRRWEFCERAAPVRQATITPGEWHTPHLVARLAADPLLAGLVDPLARSLPERVSSDAIIAAVTELGDHTLALPPGREQALHAIADGTYDASFPADSPPSARVLLPVASDERGGMEDARFVEVTDSDGPHAREYRGTYTVYDGDRIASGLLTTHDFRRFSVQRLIGSAAHSKGIALFPRRIGGVHVALSRSDGESIGLIRSADGIVWDDETPLHGPTELWDVVQSGNCGPPLETPYGWLVLTHGVGPMRVYSLGAILLDLDDPSQVIGILPGPLLEPSVPAGAGYVPHVAYSCGAIIHDDLVWIPYGVADARIRVASVPVVVLLAAMQPPATVTDRPTSRQDPARSIHQEMP